MPAYHDHSVTFGKSAWHREDFNLPADDQRRFDIAACIQLSGLGDWHTVEGEAFFAYDDYVGTAPNSKAILKVYKDGRCDPELLCYASKDYFTFTNEQAFAWVAPLVEKRLCSIETAGSLREGRVIWILARPEIEPQDIGGGDWVEPYILFSTGHARNKANTVGFVNNRVVCSNTLAMAEGNGRLIRVPHCKNQEEYLGQIRETMNVQTQQFEATCEQYRKMKLTKINQKDIQEYVKIVFDMPQDDDEIKGRTKTRLEEVTNLALHGAGQDPSELTVWSAYNGITDYLSNHGIKNAQARLASNYDGSYQRRGQRAFDVAIQLAS